MFNIDRIQLHADASSAASTNNKVDETKEDTSIFDNTKGRIEPNPKSNNPYPEKEAKKPPREASSLTNEEIQEKIKEVLRQYLK